MRPARLHARLQPRLVAAAAAASVLTATATAAADPSSTTPEQGYELGEVLHPRAVAMGGAQHALGGSTTALFVNPANLTTYRMYHLEALAAFGPEARRQSYGGAIADSSTSRLAGGFGGTWSSLDPDGIDRKWTDLRLSLAYPLGDRLSIGLTGRYLRASQAVAKGPLGSSRASDGTREDPVVNEFTFDAGASVALTESFRLGLTGKNLTAPGVGLAPTLLAGGLGFARDIFAAEADVQVDFTTWASARARFMLGGELLIADHFPIRLGYRYDDGTRAHTASAGAGYVDRRFSFELGARRDVVAEFPATTLAAGVRVFYDAAFGGSGEGPEGL